MTTNLEVKFAVYGLLTNGSANSTSAVNVKETLQRALETDSSVKIDNRTFNVDPGPGQKKHFGAIVMRDGVDRYFACEESQTINFSSGG